MTVAISKEAIPTKPLEVQLRRRALPASGQSPAVERGVMQPHSTRLNDHRTLIRSTLLSFVAKEPAPSGHSRAAVWLAATVLTACDPSWQMAFRQQVAPVTSKECIADVLRESPHIDSVAVDRSDWITFHFRDSLVPRGYRGGWLQIQRPKESPALLRLEIVWHFPAAGITAEPPHSRYLASVGQALVEHMGSRCAPGVPIAVSCRLEGLWMNESCDNPP